MPSPREQALSIGTDPSKFAEANAVGTGLPPECKEPREGDYRANPLNPPDKDEGFKVTKQGG